VLTHAGLAAARAMVVTIPDETAAELVVAAARDLAPELPIIARAATASGVRRLYAHGVQEVIHPELEGGLEIVHHTLLALGYPLIQVQHYTDAVRHDAYDTAVNTSVEQKLLRQLIATAPGEDLVGLIGDAAQVQAAAALIASPSDAGADEQRLPAQGAKGDRPPAPGGLKRGQNL
jgi:monovalent cation:H+ antiporter-2, CPA2 family